MAGHEGDFLGFREVSHCAGNLNQALFQLLVRGHKDIRVDEVICFLCGKVVFREEFINIFIMLEDDACVVVIIHLADYEQAPDIFFCQKREALAKAGNTVLIPCTGAIINKPAFCFEIVLPADLHKTVLVASSFPGFFKQKGGCLLRYIETFLMGGHADIVGCDVAAKRLFGAVYLRNGVVENITHTFFFIVLTSCSATAVINGTITELPHWR